MTAARLRAYLARLGIYAPPPPTLDGLRALHVAHLEHVPFENLSIHLGEEIVLDADALVAKIVDRRRGGFCFELNGAFATLLRGLGFEVTMLAARVFDDGTLGPPFDHMCLRVDLDEPWLADVGFGDNFRLPLSLASRETQLDEAGAFRLVEADDGELDLLRDGQAQYRFDFTPHDLVEFTPACLYHQTSSRSHFTRNTVCSLATAGGRVTVRGGTLIVTTGGRRAERALSDAELLAAYRRYFQIDLDRLLAAGRTEA